MFHISYGTHTANQQKILSNYVSVNEQSGIIAGNGGFDITVKGDTDLNGGTIVSAAPKELNSLNTGSLTFNDLENHAEYKVSSSSMGFSTGVSYNYFVQRTLASQIPQALNNSEKVSSTTYAALSLADVTINGQTATDEQLQGLATVKSDSHINAIFNLQDVQDSMALASTIGDIGALSNNVISTALSRKSYVERDKAIANAEANYKSSVSETEWNAYVKNPDVGKLLKFEFDQKYATDPVFRAAYDKLSNEKKATFIQDSINNGKPFGTLSSQEASWHQTQIMYGVGSDLDRATQAITGALSALAMGNSSGAAANLTQPYIANEIGNYFDDPQNTNETARLLAHAALGAASAYISGNSAVSGALGAASGEAIAILVQKELYGDKTSNELTQSEKETIRAVATLASGLVGAMSGGSFEDSATAAAAGYNAAVNNYLSPYQKEQKAIAETKCNQGNIEACREVLKWNKLDKEQSFVGVFIDDIVQGVMGGANGLHTIATMDAKSVDGGLIGQGLFEMITLKMGAGNGAAIGYELPINSPYYWAKIYPYINFLTYDTIYTAGSGEMYTIKLLPTSNQNWVVQDAIVGGVK